MNLMYSLPASQKCRSPYERQTSSACTHRTVTRLYDKYDCQRCTVCDRVPHFGFLYRCTQDTHGDLPASDFIDGDMAIDIADLSIQSAPIHLNVSSTTLKLPPSYPTTASLSTNATTHSDGTLDTDTATDEALAHAYNGKRKFAAAFPPRAANQPALCDMRICHTCRPTLRERAWQSLAHVVHHIPDVPHYELENRRISNAVVVRGIVLPTDPKVESPPTTAALTSEEVLPIGFEIDTTNGAEDSCHPHPTQIDTPGRADRAHDNSASDADDEKDTTKEDDESDGWTTDVGGEYSVAQSEVGRDYSRDRFDTCRPILRRVSKQRSLTSSDPDNVQPCRHLEDSSSGRTGGNKDTEVDGRKMNKTAAKKMA